jgi:hydrogenase expression/formation protein HypE
MAPKSDRLRTGKLPAELLKSLIADAPLLDERILQGPGVGIDCAVVDVGPRYHVYKSDPITFANDEIGWYAVQVNVNDIATTGATPRWFLFTLLLPAGGATQSQAEQIFEQVYRACEKMDISVIGGHSEITHGIDRPILMGSLVGEVAHDRLITPRGARPGNRILLTKGIPIETTAILARDFPQQAGEILTPAELELAADFLYQPGISVLEDARIAVGAGKVTAMHDPTEGGLSTALWELAQASNCKLVIDIESIPIPAISRKICAHFDLDPFGSIASGALLMAVVDRDAFMIRSALESSGIQCAEIGRVDDGEPEVLRLSGSRVEGWTPPERDEIAKVFERY